MHKQVKLIVFDFDGVIVESNEIKEQAFLEVFKDFSVSEKKTVEQYERQNAPKSRYEKFRELRELLRPDNISIEKEWLEKYQILTIDKVVNCSFVKGAQDFLEKTYSDYPIYLLSNTPQQDLEEIIKRRKLEHYFLQIKGSPIDKAQALISLYEKECLSPKEILFVGDSETDLEAADRSRVLFIGRNSGRAFSREINIVEDLEELNSLFFNT